MIKQKENVICQPSIIALDGERELTVNKDDEWQIQLSWDGPKVLDIEKVMAASRLMITR